MALISAHTVANEILDVLGIDTKHVKGFTIKCFANEAMQIEVHRYVDKAEGLTDLLRKEKYTVMKESEAKRFQGCNT